MCNLKNEVHNLSALSFKNSHIYALFDVENFLLTFNNLTLF